MPIRFAYWNMYWMNDLFESDTPTRFKPDDYVQSGRKGDTIRERRRDLSAVIDALEVDAIAVTEGPNREAELQLFFDTDVAGEWQCIVQPTKGSSQCIGLAVRTDTGAFDHASPPHWFDLRENGPESSIRDAVQPFGYDSDGDNLDEMHKFERLPLYAELTTAGGTPFRVLVLHLKSKGIFSAFEWSKWWAVADANRRKIVAQAARMRNEGIEPYLRDPITREIPLLICGDINDGPGMDASEKRLNASGIETLMGDVWHPDTGLGNAIFDGELDEDDQNHRDFDKLASTSFRDPIFNNTYHRVWIDHILYTRNAPALWVRDGKIRETMPSGEPIWREFKAASDHFPLTCTIDLPDPIA